MKCVRSVPFYKYLMPVLKGKPKGLPKRFHLSFSGADLFRSVQNPSSKRTCLLWMWVCRTRGKLTFPILDVNVAKGITFSFLKNLD